MHVFSLDLDKYIAVFSILADLVKVKVKKRT